MSESDTHLESYPCDWFFFDFKLAHTAVLLCFILKDQLKYACLSIRNKVKKKNNYLILKKCLLCSEGVFFTHSF